jgi:RNA polymerase-binding transcription factor DksA
VPTRTDKYKDLRKQLDQEMQSTSTDLKRLNDDLEELARDDTQEGGVPTNHMADEGSDVYDRERLMTMRVELEERADLIRTAQARMQDGTYGTCQRCGREIPRERLKARPFAVMCVQCQEEVEGEVAGTRPYPNEPISH